MDLGSETSKTRKSEQRESRVTARIAGFLGVMSQVRVAHASSPIVRQCIKVWKRLPVSPESLEIDPEEVVLLESSSSPGLLRRRRLVHRSAPRWSEHPRRMQSPRFDLHLQSGSTRSRETSAPRPALDRLGGLHPKRVEVVIGTAKHSAHSLHKKWGVYSPISTSFSGDWGVRPLE